MILHPRIDTMTRDAAAASSALSTRDATVYNAYAPVTTVRFDYDSTAIRLQFYRATPIRWPIRSFHSIHNVVDRGVLQAMWEELAGKV